MRHRFDHRSESLIDEIIGIQPEYDKTVGTVLGAFLCLNIINLAIKQTNLLPSNGLSYILGTVFLIILFLKRRILFQCNRLLIFIIYEIFFAALVMVTCLRFPTATNEVISRSIYTAVFCIPLYLMARKVKNVSALLDSLLLPSVVVLIFSGLIYLYSLSHPGDKAYNMPLGYALLCPVAFFWTTRKKAKICFFLFFISMMILFLIGSRGPLLALIIMYMLNQITGNKSTNETIKKLLISMVLLVVFVEFHNIVKLLITILGHFNIYSRSLTMLDYGVFASDSGRGEIYGIVLKVINQHSLIGFGIAGDIPALGYYPHNLFLELILHFGYPIGILISILVCLRIAINIKQKNRYDTEAYALFFACGFVPLMISNTYMQAPFMWMLLGLGGRKLFKLS